MTAEKTRTKKRRTPPPAARKSESADNQDELLLTAEEPEVPELTPSSNEATGTPPGKIDINFSGGLAAFLRASGISLAFTSYQTGFLYLIGHNQAGQLALHQAGYPQAMGVVGDADRIYLGTLTQIVRLENVLQPGQIANEAHDRLFVPRNAQTIGDVDFHEMGIRKDGRIVFVSTAYSCLAEPSRTHSFKAIWKPDFITRLAREDRCHLNGLAMVDGEPRYVTAVCRSDVVDGWRDRRHDGGIVIDIQSNEIIAEGLSMPHSPRWHDGKLWVLNSGSGELGWIDQEAGKFVPHSFFPGFLRGLAFHDQFAIVTLSKPRHGRFEGLALDDRLKDKDADAWCGIQILNLQTGEVAHWLRFDGAISELFDVCVLRGLANPLTLGPNSKEIQEFITIEQG